MFSVFSRHGDIDEKMELSFISFFFMKAVNFRQAPIPLLKTPRLFSGQSARRRCRL
jgi:hypothetical protein